MNPAKQIVDALLAEQNIAIKCPLCNAIYKLSQAKIFYPDEKGQPPKDMLEELNVKWDELTNSINKFEQEKSQLLKLAREDAIEKSKNVNLGYVIEHVSPLLPDILSKHNFKDLRHLGQPPIDFVAFDGLWEKSVRQLTFIEVKKDKARLNPEERSIKQAIEEKQVLFEEIHVNTKTKHAVSEIPPRSY